MPTITPPPESESGMRPSLKTFAEIVRTKNVLRLAPEAQLLEPVGGHSEPVAPALFGEVRNRAADDLLQLWCRETKNSYSMGRTPSGEPTCCVLLNSIAAEANAMEQGLLHVREEGDDVPDVAIDFTKDEKTNHLGRIGSLSAPHRGYDALCRDALLNGVLFGETPDGKALINARPHNATALLKLPHMAIFGAWHTQGAGGGGGAKFGRVVRSEIIGYGAMPANIAASRIDPAGILKSVPIYQPLATNKKPPPRPNPGWETDPKFAALDDKGKPILYVAKRQVGKEAGVASLVNHSTIMPSARSGRATIAGAVHLMDLSLTALRNLRFPESARAPATRERNELARTALAAYALVAMTQRLAMGYHLRSGCDLIALKSPRLEVLGASLEDQTELAIDADGARSLLKEAIVALRGAGMSWGFDGAAELTPSPQVIEAIRASQVLADELETESV